jgi:hypothetical protein
MVHLPLGVWSPPPIVPRPLEQNDMPRGASNGIRATPKIGI